MVCKIGFTNWNVKITLSRASMVVTYYIKLFRTEDDRRNGILMSPLFLVAETKIKKNFQKIFKSKSLDIITKRKVKIAKYIEVMLHLKDKS